MANVTPANAEHPEGSRPKLWDGPKAGPDLIYLERSAWRTMRRDVIRLADSRYQRLAVLEVWQGSGK